ncbi:MAG: hypothetical protein LBR23_07915 [Spirochaetaceae bacterium]|jgi:RNase P subunit RPR2|nr:hypothetical protein [Spirochaetaceae bacterium]
MTVLAVLLILVFAAVLVFLVPRAPLFFFPKRTEKEGEGPAHSPPQSPPQTQKGLRGHGVCPICGSTLFQGENVSSRVFSFDEGDVKRCVILGCPHCHPASEAGVRRRCPVCRQALPQGGYLFARMYSGQNQKNHVRITGCTECGKKI